jgi:hypothetical protein
LLDVDPYALMGALEFVDEVLYHLALAAHGPKPNHRHIGYGALPARHQAGRKHKRQHEQALRQEDGKPPFAGLGQPPRRRKRAGSAAQEYREILRQAGLLE